MIVFNTFQINKKGLAGNFALQGRKLKSKPAFQSEERLIIIIILIIKMIAATASSLIRPVRQVLIFVKCFAVIEAPL